MCTLDFFKLPYEPELGIAKAWKLKPDVILSTARAKGGLLALVEDKVNCMQASDSDHKIIIVDATEYEVGAFKVRWILEQSLDAVLDGALIGAYLTGAHRIYVLMSADYPILRLEFEHLVKDRMDMDMLGKQVVGKKLNLERVMVLPDMMETRRDEDLVAQVKGHLQLHEDFEAHGIWVEKAETFARLARGFASPKLETWSNHVFSVSGDVSRAGVFEIKAGTTLTELLALAQPKGKTKGAQIGGTEGILVATEDFATYRLGEDMVEESGSVIVFNDSRNVVALLANTVSELLGERKLFAEPLEEVDELYIELQMLRKQPERQLAKKILEHALGLVETSTVLKRVGQMVRDAYEAWPEEFGS